MTKSEFHAYFAARSNRSRQSFLPAETRRHDEKLSSTAEELNVLLAKFVTTGRWPPFSRSYTITVMDEHTLALVKEPEFEGVTLDLRTVTPSPIFMERVFMWTRCLLQPPRSPGSDWPLYQDENLDHDLNIGVDMFARWDLILGTEGLDNILNLDIQIMRYETRFLDCD